MALPYLELMRLDKPAGFLYLYIPSMAATAVAALLSEPRIQLSKLFLTDLLLLVSSVLLRGAGCAWNDVLDRQLDRQISRTQYRPLVRGAITPFNAVIFTFVQLVLFLLVQYRLPVSSELVEPTSCVLISLPFLAAIGIYPLMKRVTNYPQVFLSVPSSWGIVIAIPALGIDHHSSKVAILAMGCLSTWNAAWTVSYDLVYGFQDVNDDRKAGVKSIAVKHSDHAGNILMVLAILQTASLLAICVLIGGSQFCFLGAGVCGAISITMVRRVNLNDPADCAWWFRYGCLFAGFASSVAYCGEYVVHSVSI